MGRAQADVAGLNCSWSARHFLAMQALQASISQSVCSPVGARRPQRAHLPTFGSVHRPCRECQQARTPGLACAAQQPASDGNGWLEDEQKPQKGREYGNKLNIEKADLAGLARGWSDDRIGLADDILDSLADLPMTNGAPQNRASKLRKRHAQGAATALHACTQLWTRSECAHPLHTPRLHMQHAQHWHPHRARRTARIPTLLRVASSHASAPQT